MPTLRFHDLGMSDNKIPYIGPHDLGGQAAGPVDLHEHDLAQWERIIDAMIRVMFVKGVFIDTAQLRNGIEQLGPEAYEAYSYYERWAASAAKLCLDTGVVSEADLKAKMDELRNRTSAS